MLRQLLSIFKPAPKNAAFLDFEGTGLGIAARSKRCKKFWQRHLDLSKAFQIDSLLSQDPQETVAILGAGRLLDCPIQAIAEQIDRNKRLGNGLNNGLSNIVLYDADSLAKREWDSSDLGRRLSEIVRYEVVDLTGCIENWRAKLERFLRATNPSTDVLTEHLLSYSLELDPLLAQSFDTIISLNMLGQIPIYWREQLHSLVNEIWGIDTDPHGKYPQKLQDALDRTYALLQEQHLHILQRSSRRGIILTNDVEYFYYKQELSPWLGCPAVFCKGLELEGFEVIKFDTWFWHIAPQGIEDKEYGAIHKVEARFYKKIAT